MREREQICFQALFEVFKNFFNVEKHVNKIIAVTRYFWETLSKC